VLIRRFILVAAAAAVLATVQGGARAQNIVPDSQAQIALSFAPLVKKVAPAVVNIFTRKKVTRRQFSPLFDDPFFRRFFGDDFRPGVPRDRVQNSLGSGVVVSADGTIVTAHHVIEGADEITVVLADRREFDAKIVGSDDRTDLAVLKIDTANEAVPFLQFRDSDDLEVGDLVLAIGNPFGVGQTVTSGIVSAVARTQVGINDLNFFIQTDAAINPGNSGGALVSMDGRLIGINSAIFSRTGGSVGIGFAIPSNMVRSVLDAAADGGRIVRPWVGASGQAVTTDLMPSLGLKRPAGVLINDIYPGGPADRAGIQTGDVILGVGGREVNDPEALRFRIATRAAGDTIEFMIWRRERARTVSFPVERPPEMPQREITELSGIHPLSGAAVANLSPALADELNVDLMARGVIIVQLRRGSTAHRFQFRPGDVVRSINGEEVGSVVVIKSLLAKQVTLWRIVFERDGKNVAVVINQ
jgi:serine protease Do